MDCCIITGYASCGKIYSTIVKYEHLKVYHVSSESRDSSLKIKEAIVVSKFLVLCMRFTRKIIFVTGICHRSILCTINRNCIYFHIVFSDSDVVTFVLISFYKTESRRSLIIVFSSLTLSLFPSFLM